MTANKNPCLCNAFLFSSLTANNLSVFFTGINNLPEKYVSTCIFSSTPACVVPQLAAVTCEEEADRDDGERRHLRPRAPLLLLRHPSAPPVAVGEAGDRPRRCSMWSSSGSCTSCCVGSLRAASGSDLPSCLLEYNCLLLIYFFFLSLWFCGTRTLLRFLVNLAIWGV